MTYTPQQLKNEIDEANQALNTIAAIVGAFNTRPECLTKVAAALQLENRTEKNIHDAIEYARIDILNTLQSLTKLYTTGTVQPK